MDYEARINSLRNELIAVTNSLRAANRERERVQQLYSDLLNVRGKKPWHSRINWVNAGALLTGVIGILSQAGVVPAVVTGVVVPVVNLILRQTTTQPIVWSDEDRDSTRVQP